MSNQEITNLPITFTHSLKLEETAKGLRISVHVYANDKETAIQESFSTYLKAQQTARDNKIILAPTNGEGK